MKFLIVLAFLACAHPGRLRAETYSWGRVEIATVSFDGPVNNATADAFMEALTAIASTGQPFIPIEITSPGGEVFALQRMLGAMDRLKVPTVTICTAYCHSAGALLWLNGTYRFIEPSASIMIHDISSGTEGKVTEMEHGVATMRQMNTMLYRRAAIHIGKAANFFVTMLEKTRGKEIWFYSHEALTKGLAQWIGMPTYTGEAFVGFEKP